MRTDSWPLQRSEWPLQRSEWPVQRSGKWVWRPAGKSASIKLKSKHIYVTKYCFSVIYSLHFPLDVTTGLCQKVMKDVIVKHHNHHHHELLKKRIVQPTCTYIQKKSITRTTTVQECSVTTVIRVEGWRNTQYNRTDQNRTDQNRTEQNRSDQNRSTEILKKNIYSWKSNNSVFFFILVFVPLLKFSHLCFSAFFLRFSSKTVKISTVQILLKCAITWNISVQNHISHMKYFSTNSYFSHEIFQYKLVLLSWHISQKKIILFFS